MYEPIFLAQVRVARTITIPAGGWIILGSPDQPLAASIEQRAKLVKNGNVNDEYSAVIIGRIQDTHTPTKFFTKAEAKANAALQQGHQDSLTQSHQDALKRQKDRQLEDAKRREAEHRASVAEINLENDAIRNRGGVAAVPEMAIPENPEPKTAQPLNEFSAETLNALERGDLLQLAKTLFETGRLEKLPEGKKSDIIAAILTAKPVPLAA